MSAAVLLPVAAASAAGLLNVLVPILIIVAVALLIMWVVERWFPEFAYPTRIIVGLCVVVAILTKLLPLLL